MHQSIRSISLFFVVSLSCFQLNAHISRIITTNCLLEIKKHITTNAVVLNALNLKLDDVGTYHHRIIFNANNDKGKILMTCLKLLGYTPDTIIFVDDKEKNIKAVERAAHEANIDFIGIHYVRCNDDVLAFAECADEHEEAWYAFETEHTEKIHYIKNNVLKAS